MAGGKRSRQFRERREAERQHRREEARRQAALERRREEERERQREEERRLEALNAWRELEADLEAARARREALLAQVRAAKQAERREAEQQADRRELFLNQARRVQQQSRQAAAAEVRKGAEEREKILEARRREREQTEAEKERQDRERQERLAEQRSQEQAAEQLNSRRRATQKTRQAERDARLEAERKEARRQEQRQAEQAEARREARLEERRQENLTTEQVEARRQAERDARLEAERKEARRQEQRSEQKTLERRENARQSRREEEREAEEARGRGAAARAARQQEYRERNLVTPSPPLLQDRIPSGTLSGALPWLRVQGNRVATLSGKPVILRGVSLLGMEESPPVPGRGFAAGAGITPAGLEAIFDWNVNVIRVAINRDRVLNGSGAWTAWDYLNDLDWIIQSAAGRGAYTLLSLRRLDEATVFGTLDGERPNYLAPQPDYDTIGMWRVLGERYADEPAVLFDLYASPHAALADDLTGFDTDWTRWTLWVQMMVAELRRVHPGALCMVCGLDWGTDLSGFPVVGTGGRPIPNLIYAAQLFPQRTNPWPALRTLGRGQPVFITEWGGWQANISWGVQAAMNLRAAGCGWTAAHWNGEPRLVRVQNGRSLATGFGAVVQRELALSGEPRAALQPAHLSALTTEQL
jgi:hypothetical protein